MSNLELNCKWHFAKQLGGREDGPNDPMQDNFKKTPYASLIRESIQNSLDVPLDSTQPVRMEFSISRIRAREYSNFFELKKHIQGCIKHFPNNDDAKATYQPMLKFLNSLREIDNLYYIKVSDFNTIGMNYIKGDTSEVNPESWTQLKGSNETQLQSRRKVMRNWICIPRRVCSFSLS